MPRIFSRNGAPALHVVDSLISHDVQSSKDGKYWVLARPLGWQGLELRQRLKLAWGVFTGRYDALAWVGQE